MSAEEVNLNVFKQRQSLWEKILRQDHERNFQVQLRRDDLGGNHLLQMKEKSLQKEQEKEEDKKELGRLIHLDELHAEELRRQEEQKSLLKKLEREYRLEEISRINSHREEQAKMLLTQDENNRLAQIEMEEKLLQRKNYVMDKFTRLRLSAQNVSAKLECIQKQQAAVAAEREERSLASHWDKIQAEQVKLQKDAEKKAEALQSIADHRLKRFQERQRREEAERQINANWLQAQKEADSLYLDGDILMMAERARKEKVNLCSCNDPLEDKKGQSHIQQTQRRLDQGVKCTDLNAMLVKTDAVDVNDAEKELEQVQVLAQGHKETVQPGPAAPPADLRKASQSCNEVRKPINRPKAVSIHCSGEKSHLDNENQVIAELRIAKQKMDEADDRRKTTRVVLSTHDRGLRQVRERNLQFQLHRNALAAQHLQQVRERALQKARAERQSKKDLRRNMDRLHAQELKKVERKNSLEDISRKKEQAEVLKAEKGQTKLACVELEGKLHQEKVDSADRIRRSRFSSKVAQDAVTAVKEKQSTFTGLARRRAEHVRQQKEKEGRSVEGCTLDGGVNFSCGEAGGYVTKDAAATELTHFGRGDKKQACKPPSIQNRLPFTARRCAPV